MSTRLPFFAVLALHLPDREACVEAAATDGQALLYNPEYIADLSDNQTRGLLLHLVLHAAFGHTWRRGGRDLGRWERAADIVVNGVLRKLFGLALPPGAETIAPALEDRSVEEVYDALPPDLEPPAVVGGTGENPSSNSDSSGQVERWKDALKAAVATGDAPGNLERHFPSATSSVSWSRVLERYLTRAQHDYAWQRPDRRMMAHDLIYPSLAGEGVRLAVVVDTSGSVSPELIGAFLAECRAIRRTHPNVTGLVIYADAAVSAVHDLMGSPPPAVIGGGGTSFAPALRELERRRFQPDALVYLTDGDAEFPPKPLYPVVWVLPASSSVTPPWGETVRLK